MKQNRCVVISGGDFSPVSGISPDDFVIACDRGYVYCERLGLRPDLIISDFDSYTGPVDSEIPLNRFVSEKDDTDTMLAVRYAVEHGFHELLLCCALGGRLDVEHGFHELLLCCALGGRLDHLIANLQSLVFAQKHGLPAVLLSEDTEIRTLAGGALRIPRREDRSLSVFALDGPCQGVCITGAKYPLANAELLPSFPLGVSNTWAGEEAVISVEEGILLIVLSKIPAADPENC